MPASTASLILPVHDQADHIDGIVSSYLEALHGIGQEHEILLVPNECADDSVPLCEDLARRHGNVRVLGLDRGGWGRAVRAGLQAAAGDLLCYTNSARTTAPTLALMFAYASAYPDVVLKATRRIRDDWRRRLGSLIYNIECRVLFDLATWDINGTPKIFPRTFTKLLALQRDDDLIDAEFALVCKRESYPLVEVPILATQRHGGRSTTGYRSAAQMYWGAFRLARGGTFDASRS